jgi:hypothetical protein
MHTPSDPHTEKVLLFLNAFDRLPAEEAAAYNRDCAVALKEGRLHRYHYNHWN